MTSEVADPVVLLVDDDPDDARIVRETVADGDDSADLLVATDGTDAIAYLCDRADDRTVPPPDLVLLDPSIPNADGRELLEAVKTEPALACVPVVVLSGTVTCEEAATFYREHANAVLRKPTDTSDFADVIRSLERFWLTTARLPGRVE